MPVESLSNSARSRGFLKSLTGSWRPVLVLLLTALTAKAEVTLTEGTNLTVDVCPANRRIAMDLLGSIWILDADGGQAEIATDNLQPASRPRWSPDGTQILYQTKSVSGSRLWLLDVQSAESTGLGNGSYFDQQPAWHPDGQRIVFSSDRRDSGFDLWATDLATGLDWRLTRHPGDETEPAWSANGEDLAYIRHEDDLWRLVLRRQGQAEVDLVVSDQPLAAPSWRPDGTLLTYLRRDGREYALDMVILSDPPIVRPLSRDEDFFLSPLSWVDRERFFYTADGVIKVQNFNGWEASEVPFRAEVGRPPSRFVAKSESREVEVLNAPSQRLVIRAARLFDGMTSGYRSNMDVLIDGARIAAVKPRQEWEDATVLDLGDATILPGYIDIYSSLPAGSQREVGLKLLAFGVTTVVAGGPDRDFDAALWETEQSPGPRLLRSTVLRVEPDKDAHPAVALVTVPASGVSFAGDRELVRSWQQRGVPVLAESWRMGFRLGADLFLGAETLPASPLGNQYQDIRIAVGAGPITMVSGLADAGTPGLSQLLRSRQAQLIERAIGPARRHAERPDLAAATSTVVLGSKPVGLPGGLGLHAELRALAAAGLNGDQVLWAAGRNAAYALGLENQIGRVAPGALADLVLVAGDPRKRIADALNIVAVVRNGRFYSLVGLLEQAKSVE